jgi:hypothetical protein
VKAWKLLAVGVVALACATATSVSWLRGGRGARGVRLIPIVDGAPGFAMEESAGLFIGVRDFSRETSYEVLYAVDDAVDLAHTFVFDSRVRVIPAERVTLALSGEPVKEASRKRLKKLEDAGATISTATRDQIEKALKQQSAIAGRNGIFIISLATHGFVEDGVPYILGSDSRLTDADSAVSAAWIAEVAGTSDAVRSVLFVDACRERVPGARGAAADRRVAESFIRRMRGIDGQAIFYAAADGDLAYDGDGNGIFTRAVIEGLRCSAAKTRDMVTAEDLADFVRRYVTTWVRANRDRRVRAATMATFGGNSKNIPLARCGGLPPTVVARSSGSFVIGFGEKGEELWRKDVGGAVVVPPLVADLDSDARSDVVVAAGSRVFVLDDAGKDRWSVDDGSPVRDIAVAEQYRSAKWHVAVLSAHAVSTFDPEGKRVAEKMHRGELIDIAYGRPDKRSTPRIVVATSDRLLLLEPQSLKPEWVVRLDATVAHVDVVDGSIEVTTRCGDVAHLDFKGRQVGSSKVTAARILP